MDGVPPSLPALPVRYSDYARWQRDRLAGSELERLTAHWQERLAGSSFVLDLPTNRPRPPTAAHEGAVFSSSVSAESTVLLGRFCRAENVTPFMALLAATFTVLARWCRTTDVLIGSPIAGRTRTETEDLVGLFMNTLVIRGDVSGDPTFRELLGRVRDAAWDAYAHEEMPFERLVAALRPPREPNRTPLFQVMVALQNTPSHRPALRHLATTVREPPTGTAKFDISLSIVEAEDRFHATVEYRTALFEPQTIARLWSHVLRVLQAGMDSPGERALSLPMLTAEERSVVLTDWNRTASEYPRDTSLAELIEAAARRAPDSIAVVSGDQRLSYRELDERANRIAHRLHALGAGPDVLVGVCLERSTDLVAALLAVVKTGAAYLPVDPHLPPSRIGACWRTAGRRSSSRSRRGTRRWRVAPRQSSRSTA